VSNALTTFQNNGQLSIVIPMTPAPRPWCSRDGLFKVHVH
jgi:hypothetical protein